MSKPLYVKLFEPKGKKFAEHKKCTCQNISHPAWTGRKPQLVFDFLNEFDSITLNETSCTKKHVETELLKYFGRIEFYLPGGD